MYGHIDILLTNHNLLHRYVRCMQSTYGVNGKKCKLN